MRRNMDGRVDVANHHYIDRVDIADSAVRLDQHIAEAAERLAVTGDDLDIEQAFIGLTGRHVGINRTH